MLTATRPNEDDKQRFGKALNKAIDNSNLRIKQIVFDSGLSYNSIKAYRLGKKFPLPESAAALADALEAPHLARMANIEVECLVCKKGFIVGSQKPRAVCSDTCYKTYYSRQKRNKRRNALSRANREIKRYREAVKLHCLDCTAGEYICQMADCELRPVSPLPLRRANNHVQQPKVIDGPIRRVSPDTGIGIILIRRD